MKVAGIVAEYNPFHTGHLRLISKVREELGEDTAIVVIMSGEFVQRGAPAISDRTSRTCAALSSGVDIVLELPFTFATGSADRFAHGAISSLIASGVVTDLFFGAECDSLSDLSAIAKMDVESDPLFQEKLLACQKDGLPYAAAWQEAVTFVLKKAVAPGESEKGSGSASEANNEIAFNGIDAGRFSSIIKEPNNILAIAYLRELSRAGSSIVPHLVHREESYHEESLTADAFPSATALRKEILSQYRACTAASSQVTTNSNASSSGNVSSNCNTSSSENAPSRGEFLRSLGDLLPYIPENMLAEMLFQWNSGTKPMGEEDLLSYVLPLLRSVSSEQLSETAHMGGQLAGHLKSAIRSMHCEPDQPLPELFQKNTATRCFSYARIMRALASLAVGQKESDLTLLSDPKYLRLLGFSEKGRAVLKEMRAGSSLPILSRASDALHYGKDPALSRMDALDRASHDFWTQLARGTFEEDFKREVIQYKRGRLYR